MGADGKKKRFAAAQEAEYDPLPAINPKTPDLFAFWLQLFRMKGRMEGVLSKKPFLLFRPLLD